MTTERSRLGLGGHSFIGELGNDPAAEFDEQCAIVDGFLDNGIAWFDTTYYQERVALGKILGATGRRPEAKLTAWNFLRQPDRPDALVPFSPYEPARLEGMLAELRTDFVDLLVIHAPDDREHL